MTDWFDRLRRWYIRWFTKDPFFEGVRRRTLQGFEDFEDGPLQITTYPARRQNGCMEPVCYGMGYDAWTDENAMQNPRSHCKHCGLRANGDCQG